MNNSQIDPRTAYVRRLQDMWKRTPPTDDEGEVGNMSGSHHNDGQVRSDDPRADYIRGLTADGVRHLGGKQRNDDARSDRLRVTDEGGVVQFSDRADIPAGPTVHTNLTVGQVLRLHRDQRQRERLGGAV